VPELAVLAHHPMVETAPFVVPVVVIWAFILKQIVRTRRSTHEDGR
jgi:hypothetical protein